MNKRETMGDLLCIMIRRMHQRMGRVWLPKRRRHINNNFEIMKKMVCILQNVDMNYADVQLVIRYLLAPNSEFLDNLDIEKICAWEKDNYSLETSCLAQKELKALDLMRDKIVECQNLLKQRPKSYKVKIWGNLNGLNDIAKVFRSPQGYTTVVKTSHLPPLTLDEAMKSATFWFDYATQK